MGVTTAEEFVRFVQERWDRDNEEPHYRKEAGEVVADTRFGEIGVRASRTWLDFRTPVRRREAHLVTEDVAYIFLHPHKAEVMVTLLYSVRRSSRENNSDVPTEREAFFASFVLEEFID